MAKLIITTNGSLVGEFPLDKECITMGRKPDNDIKIEHLAVSGHHAQVITILNDSFVEDLNSTNGTFVNSKPIKKHALRDGDQISLGNFQIKYINELAAGGPENNFERTLIMSPNSVMPAWQSTDYPMAQEPAPAKIPERPIAEVSREPTAPSPLRAKLQILNGSNAGKEVELTKVMTTLGKPSVSVAAITRRAQGYFIIQVEAANDQRIPRVNGMPISSQAQPLKDHDIVEVAGIKMEFFLS
jgi:pSer/pThr/pTyr-binding forkhead associated (FHA) protein